MNNPPQMERVGVSRVQEFFSRRGWLFREQLVSDFGVDAQVEIVQQGQPIGKLVAIQIKSGESFFKETTPEGIVFRFSERHKKYWLNFSIPVVVIFYNPISDTMFWQVISKETVMEAGARYKVIIPSRNVLNEHSLNTFVSLSRQTRYNTRLDRLALDRHWMQLIKNGETVYVEFEDWVNKSLPRYNIRIGCSTCSDINEHEWPLIYGTGFEDAISYAVPWADFETDEEALEEYMESEWSANCYGHYDKEDDVTYYTQTYEEWRKDKITEGIVPVGSDGEVERYRLVLSLNEIGNAFLELDSFLTDESVYLGPPDQRNRSGT